MADFKLEQQSLELWMMIDEIIVRRANAMLRANEEKANDELKELRKEIIDSVKKKYPPGK